MWIALEEQLSTVDTEKVFPRPFLISLRLALESGLSCQQITSMILLQAALYEMCDTFDNDSLVERTHRLLELMRGEGNA
jgi:hypothetical protein